MTKVKKMELIEDLVKRELPKNNAEEVLELFNEVNYLKKFEKCITDNPDLFKYSITQKFYILRAAYLGFEYKELFNCKLMPRQLMVIVNRMSRGLDYDFLLTPRNDFMDFYKPLEIIEHVEWANLPEDERLAFNNEQIEQINLAFTNGVEHYSWWAKPEFSAEQMEIIRLGLEVGVAACDYARPDLTVKQMRDDLYEMINEKFYNLAR